MQSCTCIDQINLKIKYFLKTIQRKSYFTSSTKLYSTLKQVMDVNIKNAKQPHLTNKK